MKVGGRFDLLCDSLTTLKINGTCLKMAIFILFYYFLLSNYKNEQSQPITPRVLEDG